jgi:drug/metabolite transporter (DMT)-like permease
MPVWVPLITLWVLWGSTYLGIALVIQTMPGLLANGLRFVLAALLLGSFLALRHGIGLLRVTREQLAYSALMGVALFAVAIGVLSVAQIYVPTGVAALLIAVVPLWVVILRLAGRQRPSRLTLAGVTIGFVGLAVLLSPGGITPASGTPRDLILASLAILAGAFCWAFFSWKSVSFPLPQDTRVTTFYELLAAGLTLTGIGALFGQRLDFAEYSATSLWAAGYLVLVSIAGFMSYTWLLANAPLSLASTYAYVNPMVAVLLGWLILGEALTSDVLIGLIVITGGVALVVSGESRKKAFPFETSVPPR